MEFVFDNDYLFHCRECGTPDKDAPNKPETCHICNGTGNCQEGVRDYCTMCNGEGEFVHKSPVKYHRWARFDYYGIYTELCCDKCYKNGNYSYKKGRYNND